jgi:hypothetical protein
LPVFRLAIVGLDAVTNSITIQGPPELVETLTQYINQTDKQLQENPPRKINVIKLNQVNGNVLGATINELFKNQNQQYNPYSTMIPYGGYSMPGYGGYTTPGYGGYTMPGYGGYNMSPYGRSTY